jgi:hypothetical protein
MMMCSIPDAIASSTPYWMMGLSTSASISLGITLVAGKNRVPNPPPEIPPCAPACSSHQPRLKKKFNPGPHPFRGFSRK